jgi:hypothetical protein
MSACKFAVRRKKTKRNPREGAPAPFESLVATKIAYEKAKQAVEAAKLTTAMEGMKPFELYKNLSSNEARQPWEKIIQAQMTKKENKIHLSNKTNLKAMQENNSKNLAAKKSTLLIQMCPMTTKMFPVTISL